MYLVESSDESEGEQRPEGFKRGTPSQADPLDIRFSQKKMRHMFFNGNLLADVAPLVQTVRCSSAEEALHGARWRVVAPFPAIEVVRWRCKLRDERTGRPKVDHSGQIIYDSEEHLFTLDNRRLHCLQLAATRVWPDRCITDVSELPPGPPEQMHEMKKFKTLDCGKSIMIGSKMDKVPFVQWSWRRRLQVADEDAHKGGEQKGGTAKGAGKRNGKPARDGMAGPQVAPPHSDANAGAMLLHLLKDGGKTGEESGEAKGAFLLGLLKPPEPTLSKASPINSMNQWQNASWWEDDGGWNSGYNDQRGRRGRH